MFKTLKKPLKQLMLVSFSMSLAVAGSASAVTVKLGPLSDGHQGGGSAAHNEGSSGGKLNLGKPILSSSSNSIDVNKLQGEITKLRTQIRNEEAIRGGKGLNEIVAGNWHLDSTKTLLENLTEWQQQASIITGKDVKLLWDAPGPGDFEVSYHFTGSWDEAFTQLGHAIEKSPDWPIEISVNTHMYTVQVSAIRN